MADPLYARTHLCAEDVTPQEQERLVRLMEECGELVQACAKTLRWGWASVNPTLPPEEQETNRDYVRRELADVVALAQKLGVADSPRGEGKAWSLARTAILDGQHIDYEGREQHSARVDALASKLVDDIAAASQGEAARGGEALEAVAKARRSLEHSRLFATQQHSTRERQEMARDVIDRVEQAFAALDERESQRRRAFPVLLYPDRRRPAMSDTRTRPFSCGSEFADWSASNCEQCIAQNGCPLEAALGLAYIGDGNIAAHAAALIGCDGIYPQPCTLRHHKKDGTKTMDEVLAAIDAALNEEAHP